MNQIVISQEKNGKHPQKDTAFDILSLTNQLHHFKSTDLKDSEQKKIYFSENQVPDLIDLGQKYPVQTIALYNQSIKGGQKGIDAIDKNALALDPEEGQNKIIDKFFNQA